MPEKNVSRIFISYSGTDRIPACLQQCYKYIYNRYVTRSIGFYFTITDNGRSHKPHRLQQQPQPSTISSELCKSDGVLIASVRDFYFVCQFFFFSCLFWAVRRHTYAFQNCLERTENHVWQWAIRLARTISTTRCEDMFPISNILDACDQSATTSEQWKNTISHQFVYKNWIVHMWKKCDYSKFKVIWLNCSPYICFNFPWTCYCRRSRSLQMTTILHYLAN